MIAIRNLEKLKENLTAYIFLAPFLALLCIFMIYPMCRGIYNSFFDFRFSSQLFVGLENYIHVFTDKVYLLAIRNSLIFVFAVVSLLIIFGILISGSIYDKHRHYVSGVRTCLYIPVICSMVVMTIIWRFMLDSQTGLLRYFYDSIGMTPVNLLGDAKWTLIILVFILFTMNIGQSVVLYVASMISIPKELSEALEIDGGKRIDLFRYILIPLSKPTTLFIFVTQTAAMLRVFAVIQLLTNGGPNYASTTMMYLLYQEGLIYGNFGSASALGVVMFLMTLVLVSIQFKLVRQEK
ncbi:MAG: sugar ABC transporter permease [Clostridiaceae bacterium]|nr:sugar ABC transporter permease [Clostridiaceae bacterium]